MNNDIINRSFDGLKFELRDEKTDLFIGAVEFMIVPYNGEKNTYYEVFLNGAGKGSIKNDFERIKHLKNHDRSLTPGKIREIKAIDNYGIVMLSDLIDTTLGRETLVEYKTGIITEHSFGFRYIPEATKWDDELETLFISDFVLYEGSSLNFRGANKNTPTLNVNNFDPKDQARIEMLSHFKDERITNKIFGKSNIDFIKIISTL